MLDLNKILYFQEVARQGSISQAAKVLHISQPALSLQIKSLEEQINEKLFIRINKGLQLTPLGKELFQKSKELVEWEKDTSSIIKNQNSMSGAISIGTYTTASSYLLSPVIHLFQKKYPQISFEYNYDRTDLILKKIINYELDTAILSGIPESTSLNRDPLFKTKMMLVCSTKKKYPRSISAKDLKELPFLAYSVSDDICYQEVNKKYGKFIEKCFKPVTSESFDTLKQAMITGSGVSFIPEYIIKKELQAKEVREIKIDGAKDINVNLYFITAKGRKRSQKIDILKKTLMDTIKVDKY